MGFFFFLLLLRTYDVYKCAYTFPVSYAVGSRRLIYETSEPPNTNVIVIASCMSKEEGSFVRRRKGTLAQYPTKFSISMALIYF